MRAATLGLFLSLLFVCGCKMPSGVNAFGLRIYFGGEHHDSRKFTGQDKSDTKNVDTQGGQVEIQEIKEKEDNTFWWIFILVLVVGIYFLIRALRQMIQGTQDSKSRVQAGGGRKEINEAMSMSLGGVGKYLVKLLKERE